jgi:DNA-binding transcriptional MerR regulator
MISQNDLETVCRQCGVSAETLLSWVEEQLIPLTNEWDDEMLDMIRRIRRLTVLGVSVPGVDMILHMRRQLIEQQERIRRFEQEVEQLRLLHEREIVGLMRKLSIEL